MSKLIPRLDETFNIIECSVAGMRQVPLIKRVDVVSLIKHADAIECN